ncbi:hypothetical protein LCC91_07970 [Tepidimonas taiwanensis]|uniref:hypothetical protein n=1 Tax=Tepidimonas taiwanensis TaxID=307486 RepID=UPI0005B78105|nr:hypothetical protein [Tepidimonas taiwanensis]MCX7693193.1 hypothetical protein [Tepidimonas taiwanensis]UBQ04511.1 hypothetical protein LCC91_07970 [Tepidimonas taiwanensis]
MGWRCRVRALAAQTGEAQIEAKGEEVAAFVGLVRDLIRRAREEARFMPVCAASWMRAAGVALNASNVAVCWPGCTWAVRMACCTEDHVEAVPREAPSACSSRCSASSAVCSLVWLSASGALALPAAWALASRRTSSDASSAG